MRRLLNPERLGTQALLSYATPAAVPSFHGWTIHVASSPTYRPPADLAALMSTPCEKTRREAWFLVNVVKTADYMLSSVEIPASAKDPTFTRQLTPGGHGYQQHVWHATLGRDCHIFTNHPGASCDQDDGRPGFWSGNSIFPRQTQNGRVLMQIFSIPEDHPIQFTHAHWPTDAFDEEIRDGHWAFGRKGDGFIALWCSTPPQLRSEVLSDRELRAWGNRMAWLCLCSDRRTAGNFAAFIRSTRDLTPSFDAPALQLTVPNQPAFAWDHPLTPAR
jgi:hypothetical protein